MLDVVYEPWPTRLAAAAAAGGATVVGGALMLLHQAAAQVELMTGSPAPLEAMRAALHGAGGDRRGGSRPLEDDHGAQDVATLHRRERLLHAIQRDRLGHERVERQPPCRYRSTSMGKSREGRQSPYHDAFSAPPRANRSSSGSSRRICGVGTPTSTTVPARSRA